MTITERSERDAPQTEPGRTLVDPQPRTLGFADQIGLWGNLGVSLLGPAYAYYVLVPTDQPVSVIDYYPSLADRFTGANAEILVQPCASIRRFRLSPFGRLLRCGQDECVRRQSGVQSPVWQSRGGRGRSPKG